MLVGMTFLGYHSRSLRLYSSVYLHIKHYPRKICLLFISNNSRVNSQGKFLAQDNSISLVELMFCIDLVKPRLLGNLIDSYLPSTMV